MQAVEEGKILTGKVTGVTKFGAFVELEGGETGLVQFRRFLWIMSMILMTMSRLETALRSKFCHQRRKAR